MIPPQSPAFFIALFDVKTIGSVSKPSAIIVAPFVIIKVALEPVSARITVPGSIVRTALLDTYTFPCKRYTFFLYNLVFSVIFPANI